jgi:hypothetical protein
LHHFNPIESTKTMAFSDMVGFQISNQHAGQSAKFSPVKEATANPGTKTQLTENVTRSSSLSKSRSCSAKRECPKSGTTVSIADAVPEHPMA